MQLSERQQRAAASAITILSLVVIVAAAAGIMILAALFLRAFYHVFLPIVVAGVAALVCQPYFEWLRTRLRLPAPLALIVFFLSIALPFAAFGTVFGTLLADQIGDLIHRFPAWWKNVQSQAQDRWPEVVRFLDEHPVGQRVKQAVQEQQDTLLHGLQVFGGKALSAGAGVVRGVGIVFGWAVTPVYFAFFLLARRRDPAELDNFLPFLKPETREDVIFLVREFINIIVAFFRGQLLIALLQGILFAIGFSIVGLRYGFVLGILLGFLNIIPYLGSIVGLGITLPLSFFQGGGGLGTTVGVIVVFVLVQLIEGYVLTPRIMGDRTGLHPMAIIFAVFFWGTALGGILGMILAIPLTAFLVVFWRLAREKYIDEWV